MATTKVKNTRTLAFQGDYDENECIEFRVKRIDRRHELEMWAFKNLPSNYMVTRVCEYGHKHLVKSEIKRDLVHIELDVSEIKELVEFLKGFLEKK